MVYILTCISIHACTLKDLIEQAAKCKAEGNAHFTAQRNNAAMEAYREGIAILPLRKIPPKEKKSAQDSGGKGKQREDPSSSDDESIKEEQQSNTQIRELADEEDEKAFVAQGKISDEEKQVIELRGALWNNLAAAQMRLVCYSSTLPGRYPQLTPVTPYSPSTKKPPHQRRKP